MTVKEFTDMLGSFNNIVVMVEKEEKVIAFDGTAKQLGEDYDLEVELKLTSKEVEYSIAEINHMEVTGVTTAINGNEIHLWLDV